MWVRKTEEELKREEIAEQKRENSPQQHFLHFAVLFSLALVVVVSLQKIGAPDRNFDGIRAWPEHNWSWIVEHLPLTTFWVAVGTLLVYTVLYLANKGKTPQKHRGTLFCPKCYSTALPSAGQKCSCGNTFEELETWKWIDSHADPVARANINTSE